MTKKEQLITDLYTVTKHIDQLNFKVLKAVLTTTIILNARDGKTFFHPVNKKCNFMLDKADVKG